MKVLSVIGSLGLFSDGALSEAGNLNPDRFRRCSSDSTPDDSSAYAEMAKAANPYGDSRAADRIVNALMNASKQV